MGTLVNLNPVAEQIQGFQLENQQDMFTALDYVTAFPSGNYSGMVQVQNVGGTRTFQLLINNTATNSSGFAEIGDIIIIENGTLVKVVKQADFGSLYTVAG